MMGRRFALKSSAIDFQLSDVVFYFFNRLAIFDQPLPLRQ